jgi:hypothetical protein
MSSPPRIHAICLALNEEVFIENTLRTLYPFCSGISVLTQYDRDWYGKPVEPDGMLQRVAQFSDPEGKIHLVLRRFPDEAAARNMEMYSLLARPHRGTQSHGRDWRDIASFHEPPEYFWIVDADEIYDPETVPAILDHLAKLRPRGMRVLGHNYVRTWNRRVPVDEVRFCHFGFLRAGVMFENRRVVSWNESRVAKLLGLLKLPDFSAKLWGFVECPAEVGVFHHGCWLGDDGRLKSKSVKSSHQKDWDPGYGAQIDAIRTVRVPTAQLPRSIREGTWPEGWIERGPGS